MFYLKKIFIILFSSWHMSLSFSHAVALGSPSSKIDYNLYSNHRVGLHPPIGFYFHSTSLRLGVFSSNVLYLPPLKLFSNELARHVGYDIKTREVFLHSPNMYACIRLSKVCQLSSSNLCLLSCPGRF